MCRAQPLRRRRQADHIFSPVSSDRAAPFLPSARVTGARGAPRRRDVPAGGTWPQVCQLSGSCFSRACGAGYAIRLPSMRMPLGRRAPPQPQTAAAMPGRSFCAPPSFRACTAPRSLLSPVAHGWRLAPRDAAAATDLRRRPDPSSRRLPPRRRRRLWPPSPLSPSRREMKQARLKCSSRAQPRVAIVASLVGWHRHQIANAAAHSKKR